MTTKTTTKNELLVSVNDIGVAWLIETVTHYRCGVVVEVTPSVVYLKNASTVYETGPLKQAMEGNFKYSERLPDGYAVPRAVITGWMPLAAENLPKVDKSP